MIEEVRTRNDIVDVISEYVKLQEEGEPTISGSVPSTMRNRRPFPCRPSKQMYYCFGCGAGGNVITFVMEYENYTFPGGP